MNAHCRAQNAKPCCPAASAEAFRSSLNSGLRYLTASTKVIVSAALRVTGGQIPGKAPGPLFRPSTRPHHPSLILLCVVWLGSAGPAAAQQYPSRPIRLIVPTTPGGSVDTLARTVGPKLAERWGQQVVVDNRSGAGGTIAAEFTARAVPDGYTLMIGTIAGLATNVSLQQKLQYDPVRDFAPVTLVATQNLVLTVHPSIPAKSVRELVKFAKSRPGQLTFASAGNGTGDRKSTRLNSSHTMTSRMPSSA